MNYYNYYTEIEEHFVRRRGKHLYISPLDWSLIEVWRDSGVPWHVALRGIDQAMDAFLAKRSRTESRVSTLFYCHPSVMEEFARHMEAHLGETPVPPSDVAAATPAQKQDPSEAPDKKSVLEFLEARIREIKPLSAKLHELEVPQDGIDRIASRLEEIRKDLDTNANVDFAALERDLAILDEALVALLREGVAPDQLVAWEKEAKKELRIYRKKLPKDTFGKILVNFQRTKIHTLFGIGELSLFHM